MEELHVEFRGNKEFTYEELEKIAEEIFSENKTSLDELKNTPWYKKLFKSLVFQQGNKRLVLKNIKNLANLQSIFLKLYIQELKNQNTDLNKLIEDVIVTQEAVKKLYNRCALKFIELGNIADLKKNDTASNYLVWFLTLFREGLDIDEKAEKRLQSYNLAVRKYLGVVTVNMTEDISTLERIGFHEVFYRCALEQCIVTNRFDKENEYFDFPEKILTALDYLNVSRNKVNELRSHVKNELENFGQDLFIEKYGNSKDWIDLEDLELVEDEDIEEGEEDDKAKNEVSKDSFDRIQALIITAVNNESFGKKVDKNDKKEWLLTRLSFLTPKTVIAVTKGDQYYFVFTTYALYVYEADGFLTSENFWCIRYENISETNISVVLNKDADIIIFEDNGGRVVFSDKKVNAQKLEQLLLEVKRTNGFAKTDKKLNFDELDLDIKIGYYHIISAILKDNGLPLFELFRTVVDNGLECYWKKINQEEKDINNFVLQWQDKIPYPYEEAIALKLIGNICSILQFTKQNEALNASEKKYFSLILNSLDISEREEAIKNQIICSQVEKKFIEGKQVESELEVLMGYIKDNKYGILTVTGSSVVSIGLMVLGPLGWISRIISFMGVSIFDYISKRKVREANKAELRVKLYKETYLSYKRALKALENMDNKDLLISQKLKEGISVLQKNSGLNQQILLSTHIGLIEETIKNFLNELKKKYKDNYLGQVVIASELSYFAFQNLVAQMSLSLGSEDLNSVIGLHNGKVLLSIMGNYSGILFVKEGCYIKPDKSSPIKFIFYSEIQSVNVKGSIIEEVVLNLFDGTKIKLDGYNYKDDGSDILFKKIAAWNKEDLN